MDALSPLTLRAIKATADVIVPPFAGVATVLNKVGPIPVQMEDFHLTLPKQWFSDEVVHLYVELLRGLQLKFASSVRPTALHLLQLIFLRQALRERTVKLRRSAALYEKGGRAQGPQDFHPCQHH